MFSKKAIKSAVNKGLIKIDPFDLSNVESAHVNLHIQKDLTIGPKGFALAQTVEKVTLSNTICGFVEGRASLAKNGISVEQSSTFVEPGTDNHITLEIFNASDERVELTEGKEIAKLFFLAVVDDI